MPTRRAEYLESLVETARSLPTATLGKLLDFAAYLRSREEWEATQELLADPETRAQVLAGRDQARRGEGRPWREIQRGV